jgi:hypothetical protein
MTSTSETQEDRGRHSEQHGDSKFAPKIILTKWVVGASGPQGPSAPPHRSEHFANRFWPAGTVLGVGIGRMVRSSLT